MMAVVNTLLFLLVFCTIMGFMMFPMIIGVLNDAGLLRRFQNPAAKVDALAVWEQTKVSMEHRLQQFLSAGDLEGSAKVMEMLERHKVTMPAIPFWKKLK